MPTRGRDLKDERLLARVKVVDLAARMGITRATLWVLENRDIVDDQRAEQYRTALKAARDVTTTPAA